jgi:MYXO-CTERM domain-containing protein
MWLLLAPAAHAGFVDVTPAAMALGGGKSTGAVFLDLEQDGDWDVLVPGDGGVRLLLGDGTLSNWTDVTALSAPELQTTLTTRGLLAADLDHDGYPDLVHVENYLVEVLHNSGPPNHTLQVAWTYAAAPETGGFEGAALLDAARDGLPPDGWLDLLVTEAAHANWMLYNPADGSLALQALDQSGLGMTLSAINSDFATAGDWSGDGLPDVVIRGGGAGPDAFLAGLSGWTAVPELDLDASNEAKGTVSLCDVDADGALDLFWANPGLLGFRWTGSLWEDLYDSAADLTASTQAAACGDLDADGVSDLWVSTTTSADGLFGPALAEEPLDGATGAKAVSLADLDADGDLDALLSVDLDSSVLLRNDDVTAPAIAVSLRANVAPCPSTPVLRDDLGGSVRRLDPSTGAPVGSRLELSGGAGRSQTAWPVLLVGGLPAGEVLRLEVDFQYGGEGPFVLEMPPGLTSWEILQDDPDGDGITTAVEREAAGTEHGDKDGDGLLDWADEDADGDGVPDALEAGGADRCAPAIDSDGDGLADLLDTDSDDDGLADGDPLEPDRLDDDVDGDGLLDGEDPDPLVPEETGTVDPPETGGDTGVSTNTDTDTDAGTGPDTDTPEDPAPELDSDGDGLSDADELAAGTDPGRADTDGDGVWDGIDADPLDAGGKTGSAPAVPGCGCAAGGGPSGQAALVAGALLVARRRRTLQREREVRHRR